MSRQIAKYENDKGLTLEDWLSPEEVEKLRKALEKDGWICLHIVKNLDKKKDYYYINGQEVFERLIK